MAENFWSVARVKFLRVSNVRIAKLLEPFRIVCPSCSSKIVVRHAQLVGQTLPCPKCQTPILVVAAVKEVESAIPVEAARAQVINSDAITQVDPADWNMDALDGNRLPDFVPWAASPDSSSDSRERTAAVASASITATISPIPVRTSPTSAKWESQNAVARRNVLLLTSITAGGLLIATLAFVAFIRIYGKTSDRRAADANTESNVPPENKSVPEPDGKPTPSPVDILESETDTIRRATEGDPQVNQPILQNTESPTNESNENQSMDNAIASPLFPEADPDQSIDDPAQGNPARREEQAETPNADDASPEDNLPPIFQDFQRMFDPPSRSNWDDIGIADRKIENEISIENAELLHRDEFYPPAIAIPSWSERSERMLVSIQTKPMPLLRCIDWFSKVSNTGITVDWFDMNLAGIDWNEPITIAAQNESLGTILGQLLQQRDLELVIDAEGFPHVRPTQERIQNKLGSNTIFDPAVELAALPQELRDAVVPLLIRLLDLSSCTYFEGKLEWSKDASHYDKARFMASLRNVRETIAGKPRIEAFPLDVLDFGRPDAWWKLRQRTQSPVPMEQIVYEDRPVIDLLASAAAASKSRLVIDWPAVWSHGFHPNRMSVSVLRGRSLEEISNRYLEDYSLELIPLDSETVLLTTDAVRRSIERVIAVRLDQGLNLDDLKTAIRSIVPRGLDQRSRFKLEMLPGDDKVALLRICLPTIAQFRDEELQKALGIPSQAP